MLSHYPNQYWYTINKRRGNEFQWNLNENTNIFIQENRQQNDDYSVLASMC